MTLQLPLRELRMRYVNLRRTDFKVSGLRNPHQAVRR